MKQKVRFMLVCFIAALAIPMQLMADHGEAVVSDIDGDGFGKYTGFYDHESGSFGDHPWFTFDASSGDVVTINLETDFNTGMSDGGSFFWVYEVVDGNAEVGDASAINGGNELVLILDATDDPGFTFDDDQSHTLTFAAPSSNQFIIQVDSWLGASGDYNLTISIPEPSTAALICAVVAPAVCRRRR